MPRVNLIGSSNRQTNQTCVFGSMAGLAPTATVRPNVTGINGYKSARVAANSFYWLSPHDYLNQAEKDAGCGLGKKGTKACTDGKSCIELIGFSKRVVQYYPGKKLLH